MGKRRRRPAKQQEKDMTTNVATTTNARAGKPPVPILPGRSYLDVSGREFILLGVTSTGRIGRAYLNDSRTTDTVGVDALKHCRLLPDANPRLGTLWQIGDRVVAVIGRTSDGRQLRLASIGAESPLITYQSVTELLGSATSVPLSQLPSEA